MPEFWPETLRNLNASAFSEKRTIGILSFLQPSSCRPASFNNAGTLLHWLVLEKRANANAAENMDGCFTQRRPIYIKSCTIVRE